MPTLTEYFEAEARACLERLNRLLSDGRPDPDVLLRQARTLRGCAQMAREERVYRAGLVLEGVARAVVGGARSWSEDLSAGVRATVADLRALVERGEAESALDRRLEAVLSRWQQAGVELPAAALGRKEAPSPPSATGEFRSWVAQEVEGIADALDSGLRVLTADPMDREALKGILRRQRALLGAARLDEVPVVAEILRAVEDLTRVIAKLDVGVKQEWLDIYRVAREGLKATVEALRSDRNPEPSHSLARLRHMREELLERYGTGEAVNAAASANEGLVQARRCEHPETAHAVATTPLAVAEAEPVPIEELQYRGEAALRRAVELRSQLERAVGGDAAAAAALEEVFDLFRLALA